MLSECYVVHIHMVNKSNLKCCSFCGNYYFWGSEPNFVKVITQGQESHYWLSSQ